jgi:hypothetical protein
LEREHAAREKERTRLRGRFGIDLLGPDASEEELLAYACMLSEETYTSDETKRRDSDSSSDSDTVAPNDSPTPRAVLPYTPPIAVLEPVNEELDSDVLEAIRRSLEDADMSQTESPPPHAAAGSHAEASTQQEDTDLEFAVLISIAEQRSLGEEEEFPTLGARSASSSPQGRRGRKGKEVFRG